MDGLTTGELQCLMAHPSADWFAGMLASALRQLAIFPACPCSAPARTQLPATEHGVWHHDHDHLWFLHQQHLCHIGTGIHGTSETWARIQTLIEEEPSSKQIWMQDQSSRLQSGFLTVPVCNRKVFKLYGHRDWLKCLTQIWKIDLASRSL